MFLPYVHEAFPYYWKALHNENKICGWNCCEQYENVIPFRLWKVMWRNKGSISFPSLIGRIHEHYGDVCSKFVASFEGGLVGLFFTHFCSTIFLSICWRSESNLFYQVESGATVFLTGECYLLRLILFKYVRSICLVIKLPFHSVNGLFVNIFVKIEYSWLIGYSHLFVHLFLLRLNLFISVFFNCFPPGY